MIKKTTQVTELKQLANDQMNLIVMTHAHRHGIIDQYQFRSPLKPSQFPNQKALAKIFDIEFYQDLGETIECGVNYPALKGQSL